MKEEGVKCTLHSQNICLNELVARSLKTPLDENRRDNWPFLRKRVVGEILQKRVSSWLKEEMT